MKRKMKLVLAVIALLMAGLACFAPAYNEPSGLGELASTPSPSREPEATATPPAPPAAGPQTFTGEAVKNDFASDGAVCLVYQPFTLVVKDDGAAELSTVGADVIDHANCMAGSSQETWYINGVVDAAAQVINFQTCNFGRFTAAGSLSFGQGLLVGQVSCTNPEGIKFITLVIGK